MVVNASNSSTQKVETKGFLKHFNHSLGVQFYGVDVDTFTMCLRHLSPLIPPHPSRGPAETLDPFSICWWFCPNSRSLCLTCP